MQLSQIWFDAFLKRSYTEVSLAYVKYEVRVKIFLNNNK